MPASMLSIFGEISPLIWGLLRGVNENAGKGCSRVAHKNVAFRLLHVISDSGPARVGQERTSVPSSGQSAELSSMVYNNGIRRESAAFHQKKMLI